MAIGLLRQQNRPGPLLGLRLAIGGRQVRGSVVVLENDIGNLPRLHDRLGEYGARILGGFLLVGVIAPNTDDKKQWQLEVVDKVAQGVAGLEQAGTLDKHDRTPPAQ